MIDAAALEYYKLAAGVIPVLWVGQAFQFIGPEASRREIELLGSEAYEAGEAAEKLKEETEQWALAAQVRGKEATQKAAEYQEAKDELSRDPENEAKKQRFDELDRDRQELLAVELAEKEQAEGDTRSGDLRNKANELLRRQRTLKKSTRRLALLAVVAVPAAFLSEALSLYGVYANNTATFITVIVTFGLALGGVLLIAPLWIGWMRLRAWL